MGLRKKITLTVVGLVGMIFTNLVFGQISINYSIGFIPNIVVNNNIEPSYSSPLLYSQNNKCINLNSGLSKYSVSSSDSFSISCLIEPYTEIISFIIYPNPTTTGNINIRLTNKISNEPYLLVKVIANNGNLYKSFSVSTTDLLFGYPIILSGLSNGQYIINISSITKSLQSSKKILILR